MKLHSLDISGFKSFPDPVDVKFAGGITAIVGPNGCGKSNLVDAITWVLGEQSAKFLRGSKMEDVIFNGSSKRKPLGLAEVSLTLAADSSVAEAADGKITISRRVFRTGGSQYRLNGKVVRLKQIKDMLMDTGLGIRAYSVIEQGRIGMILSGKPQERRKLLEEAAGITRYKARKRIAEIKLEEATANLLRLDDIISEVQRALRSLKRQANAARRYQTREREYHQLLKNVLLGRWALVREDLIGLEVRLEELTGRDAELTATLHRDEATLAEGRESLDQLAAELAERHEDQAQLAATIEGRQEFLKGARQRSDEFVERLHSGRTQADERRRQASDYKHSLGTLDERTTELIRERDEAARVVAEDDEKIAACQSRVEDAADGLETLGQTLGTATKEATELSSELQRAKVEIERRTYRRHFLGEEGERLEKRLEEARTTLEEVDARVGEISGQLEENTERHDVVSSELEDLLRRESETNDEARHLESHLAGLEQRRRILVELSEEHAERRRALVERLGEVGLEDPSFLAEQATPPEGWEDAVDRYLSDLADAVVLGPDADAIDLARRLAELGGSGIFLRPLSEKPATEPTVDDPSLVQSLTEALGLTGELAAALPPAYLVQTSADAERLAAKHPGVAFISRDRLWAQGGALHVHGVDAAPGVLARESELEAIHTEIPDCSQRLEQAKATIKTLVAERTTRAVEANRLAQRIAELQREAAVAQARRQDAAARHEKLEGERRSVADEDGQLLLELGSLEGDSDDLEGSLAKAEMQVEQLREEVAEAQAAVEAAKEEREALRTAGAGRRGRLELLEERLESHNQEAARVQNQITYSEQQLAIWSREDDALQRRLGELEASMKEAEAQLQIALERQAETQDAVLAQQERLDARREDIRGLEDGIQSQRAGHEELRTEIEGLRVARAGVSQDAEHLSISYREEFKLALPGTLEKAPETQAGSEEPVAEDVGLQADEAQPEALEDEASLETVVEASEEASDSEAEASDDAEAPAGEPFVWVEDDVEIPAPDRAALAENEAELAKCKAILERLGPVNVLAAQEYDEQFERNEFLTTQRLDVTDSVRRLQTTIAEINETSAERFRETFVQVNAKFGETFSRLFRGGEAEMRLFDEDDILDTGIEIIARPPGKRAQNIMLLSGGEKALTAVALLFALFQTRASPFCILDEVDAPLDDVNVLRFVETLKELAEDTQFLIVTHNKLTMEVASTLYGVTMEERGVSKLVSVEIEHVQPEVEQAATA